NIVPPLSSQGMLASIIEFATCTKACSLILTPVSTLASVALNRRNTEDPSPSTMTAAPGKSPIEELLTVQSTESPVPEACRRTPELPARITALWDTFKVKLP